MERIAHRANTRKRIREGIRARFDRFEVDLWNHNGRFILSHDPVFGPFVFGSSGATLSSSKWLYVRWGWPFLTLAKLLRDKRLAPLPSLLIDLKGAWPDNALEHLATLLQTYRRSGDAICTQNWEQLDRYARIDPKRTRIYSEAHQDRLGELFLRMERGETIAGLSINAAALASDQPLDPLRHILARSPWFIVYVWNIPDFPTLRNLQSAGIDGAIIDYLGWI